MVTSASNPHFGYTPYTLETSGLKGKNVNYWANIGFNQSTDFLAYNVQTNKFSIINTPLLLSNNTSTQYSLTPGTTIDAGYHWAEGTDIFYTGWEGSAVRHGNGDQYIITPLSAGSFNMGSGRTTNGRFYGSMNINFSSLPIVSSAMQYNSLATSGFFSSGVRVVSNSKNGNYITQYQLTNNLGIDATVSPITYDLYKWDVAANGGTWSDNNDKFIPATSAAIDGYNELSPTQKGLLNTTFNSNFTSTYNALSTTQQNNVDNFLQEAEQPANNDNTTTKTKQTFGQKVAKEIAYDNTAYNIQTGNYKVYYAGNLYTPAQIKNDPNLKSSTLTNPSLPFNQVFSQPFVVVSQTIGGNVTIKGMTSNNDKTPSVILSADEYLLLCVQYPEFFNAQNGAPVNNPLYSVKSTTSPASRVATRIYNQHSDIVKFNAVFEGSIGKDIQVTPADVANIGYSTTQAQLSAQRTTITNTTTGKSIELNNKDYILLAAIVPQFPALGTATTIKSPFGNNVLTPASLVGFDILFTPRQQLKQNFENATTFKTSVGNVKGTTVLSDIITAQQVAEFNSETLAQQQATWNKLTPAQQYALWNNDSTSSFFNANNAPIPTYNANLIEAGSGNQQDIAHSLYNFTAGPNGATFTIGTSIPSAGQGNSSGSASFNVSGVGNRVVTNGSVLYLAPGTTVSIQSLISGGSNNQYLYSVAEFNTPSGQNSTITVNNSTVNITNGTIYALPGVQYSSNTNHFSSDMPNGQEKLAVGANTTAEMETYSSSNGSSDLISSLSLKSGSLRNDNTNIVWMPGSTTKSVLSTSPGTRALDVDWSVGFNDHIALADGVAYNGTFNPFNGGTSGNWATHLTTTDIPMAMGLAIPGVEAFGTLADIGVDTDMTVDTSVAGSDEEEATQRALANENNAMTTHLERTNLEPISSEYNASGIDDYRSVLADDGDEGVYDRVGPTPKEIEQNGTKIANAYRKYSNIRMFKGTEGLRALLRKNGELVTDINQLKGGDTIVISRANFGRDAKLWENHGYLFTIKEINDADLNGTTYEGYMVTAEDNNPIIIKKLDVASFDGEGGGIKVNRNIGVSPGLPGSIDMRFGMVIKNNGIPVSKMKYLIKTGGVFKVNASPEDIRAGFIKAAQDSSLPYNNALRNCNHCVYDTLKNVFQ